MGRHDNNEMQKIDNHQPASWSHRLRYWLIEKLAHGEPIMMNTVMRTPPGWAVARRDFGDGGMLINNTWVGRADYEFMPGQLIMWRDENGLHW